MPNLENYFLALVGNSLDPESYRMLQTVNSRQIPRHSQIHHQEIANALQTTKNSRFAIAQHNPTPHIYFSHYFHLWVHRTQNIHCQYFIGWKTYCELA